MEAGCTKMNSLAQKGSGQFRWRSIWRGPVLIRVDAELAERVPGRAVDRGTEHLPAAGQVPRIEAARRAALTDRHLSAGLYELRDQSAASASSHAIKSPKGIGRAM